MTAATINLGLQQAAVFARILERVQCAFLGVAAAAQELEVVPIIGAAKRDGHDVVDMVSPGQRLPAVCAAAFLEARETFLGSVIDLDPAARVFVRAAGLRRPESKLLGHWLDVLSFEKDSHIFPRFRSVNELKCLRGRLRVYGLAE
jgi:hypothetical protein